MVAGSRHGLLEKTQGCVKKLKRMIDDVTMNFALMNCQSLKLKLNSLADNFKTNKNSFITANETWFKSRDPQLNKKLVDLEDEHNMIVLRKDRKAGKKGLAHGGVAVFFNSTKCMLKKFQLNALRGREVREYEILAVKGNLRGIKKEIVVFSCYIPPKVNKEKVTSILEYLTDDQLRMRS